MSLEKLKQIELNNLLDKALCEDELDLLHIKRLLDDGADPLGELELDDDMENPMSNFFANCQWSLQEDKKSKRILQMPDAVELFLERGIELDNREYFELQYLTWLLYEEGIQALNHFLKYGLSIDNSETFVDFLMGDVYIIRNYILEPDRRACDIEELVYALKMTMLIAAYNVNKLDECPGICQLIRPDENNTSILEQFKRWNDFEYEIVFPDDGVISWRDVQVHIYNKDKEVWKFNL